MPKYVLLLHESSTAFPDLSPEDMQAMIQRYKNWRGKLNASGEKLQDGTGRTLRGAGSSLTVSDGPHAETKEVIGGFFIIEAKDYDEAVELSRDCPHLDFGTIEVRQVDKV